MASDLGEQASWEDTNILRGNKLLGSDKLSSLSKKPRSRRLHLFPRKERSGSGPHGPASPLLRPRVPVIDEVEHRVAREGASPGLQTALGVDLITRVGDLMEEVKALKPDDQLSLEQ